MFPSYIYIYKYIYLFIYSPGLLETSHNDVVQCNSLIGSTTRQLCVDAICVRCVDTGKRMRSHGRAVVGALSLSFSHTHTATRK